jgi:uncharacterized protein with von Willebrand factor type A (vWA) domain
MGFDAQSLRRRYARLADCPNKLRPALITLPLGDLTVRLNGVLAWRIALLAGSLPQGPAWPSPFGDQFKRELETLNLVRFLKDEPESVDELLLAMLQWLRGAQTELEPNVLKKLAELEQLERRRVVEQMPKKKQVDNREKLPDENEQERLLRERMAEVKISEKALARLRLEAEAVCSSSIRSWNSPDWQERSRQWAELHEVFGDLGSMMGRGMDFSRSILRHVGWAKAAELTKLIKQLPQLREIVQTLGQLRQSQTGESVSEKIMRPAQRIREMLVETITPGIPPEIHGVERSGDIARMLPSEALLMGHPRLKYLWHARRAENALVSYRMEGIDYFKDQAVEEFKEEGETKTPRPERGPIVAVIDTSGSMHGEPEIVAKAVVLEAARTAHAEGRDCLLYAYSGPKDVIEHRLCLDPEGIQALLKFLSFSFGGGTDIGVICEVVQQLKNPTWTKADVIIATDGEWHASADIVNAVEQAKEAGTRFHGVQIGNTGRTGLHQICDPVHVFRNWLELRGGRVERG